MRIVLAVLALGHGAVHVMGFSKAFGLATLSALQQPISRPVGLLWLLAAGLLVLTSGLLLVRAEGWWMAAAPALVLSQTLIVLHWRDAWFGSVANAVILIPLALSLLDLRPSSFPATFTRLARDVVDRTAARDTGLVTERDLASLPAPLQRYLRFAGAVGRPRVVNFRVRFRGDLRSTPQSAWMPSHATQVSAADPAERLFLVESKWRGVPFAAFHRYEHATATMQVRLLSAIGVVDARGDKMDQSETVTVFNDMCLLAPATLVGATVHWTTIDERTLEGAFTNGAHTVRARLLFGADGALENFVSSDRYRSLDGTTYEAVPWSTPIRDYVSTAGRRVPAHADASWALAEGAFSYARFTLVEIEYNVRAGEAHRMASHQFRQETRHD